MDKIFGNWTYQQVAALLDGKGFKFYEDLADAQSWVELLTNGQSGRFVEVKFTQRFYAPKTLEKMIRQSGVPEAEWIEWAKQ